MAAKLRNKKRKHAFLKYTLLVILWKYSVSHEQITKFIYLVMILVLSIYYRFKQNELSEDGFYKQLANVLYNWEFRFGKYSVNILII